MVNGAKTIPAWPSEQPTPTIEEISKALEILAESRGIVLGQTRLELYLEDLADLPIESLLKAIAQYRRKGPAFFPQVPELRRLVNSSNEDAQTEHAWQCFERWVKQYYSPDQGIQGRWNSKTFAYDPVPRLDMRTERAMRALGGPHAVWATADYGEGTTENYPFVKRDFIAAWRLAPAVEKVAARALEAQNPKLLGKVKALAQAKSM